MRKIQIERKLFELFGHKFLVFENFEDSDLNIDDELTYKDDNKDKLVDIFVANKFYSIWSDERRHNASIICACHGNLKIIIDFLKKIGVSTSSYATFNCHLHEAEDTVLYMTSEEAMQTFIKHLYSGKKLKKLLFSSNVFPLRKNKVSQL
ncbi:MULTISPECIES: hypothetical protein [Legionella]|uniref:Uncharacterized protein n=1 Tax=Legionella drozanskii LLAP-1 TaxID=1212489 RepID=A0A0W0SX08_9GAMM|nr:MULTISPECIES: hypothetical protein [Legionella]KTC87878.1 hypothetical protein Ldro_1497 [Legionella drozanskii LLAP-1]PJE09098.1 MAG: hypothetical protein CK430_11495 [Legionella sp.]